MVENTMILTPHVSYLRKQCQGLEVNGLTLHCPPAVIWSHVRYERSRHSVVALVLCHVTVLLLWCNVMWQYCCYGAMSCDSIVAMVQCQVKVLLLWCNVMWQYCCYGAMSCDSIVAMVQCHVTVSFLWCYVS